jgi:hypothetical protein
MKDKLFQELNDEIERLIREYVRLKNKPKPFETEDEKGAREIQIEYDKQEKSREFDFFKDDFEKKRDYVLKLKKEVEALKLAERRDELEQKLRDQTITEKELLELLALNRTEK